MRSANRVWRSAVPRLMRAAVVIAALPLAGCGPIHMILEPAPSSCRAQSAIVVRWIGPEQALDRDELARWCDAVGAVANHEPAPRTSPTEPESAVIVSWNTGVGRGHIRDLVES